MSYDPSHRRLPPRQGGWPQATPPRAWPAHRDDSAYRDADQASGQEEAAGQGSYWADASSQPQPAYQDQSAYQPQPAYQDQSAHQPQPAYQDQSAYQPQPAYQDQSAHQPQPAYQGQSAYQPHPVYQGAPDYQGQPAYQAQPAYLSQPAYGAQPDYPAEPGYQDAGGYGLGAGQDYFDGAPDYFDRAPDGLAGNRDGFTGPADHQGRDKYAEPRRSGPMLTAPDAGMLPHHWQADRDRRREQRRRGPMVGAVTGFLAAAVAIGVAILATAFVRPQTSPIVAIGNVFIDRTPTSLKNLAVAHFGQHGRTVLLLGMYVIIALLAMVLGALTRRVPALGVASIAAGALVAAFVTVTRPQGQAADAIPWVIGGMAGVTALLWLVRSSAPVVPVRPARGGNRRRA